MIGTIDIELQADRPSVKIQKVSSYVSSPSTFIIRGLPRSLGAWRVNGVKVQVLSPDGVQAVLECINVGDKWVGTISGCATSGYVENGIVITADCRDERGEEKTGYVVGVGDYEILALDQSIDTTSSQRVYLATDLANVGNIIVEGGYLKIKTRNGIVKVAVV